METPTHSESENVTSYDLRIIPKNFQPKIDKNKDIQHGPEKQHSHIKQKSAYCWLSVF